MAKPHKSTFDTFVDQFAAFDVETQARAMDLMEYEHRRSKRMAAQTNKDRRKMQEMSISEHQAALVAQQNLAPPNQPEFPDEIAVDYKEPN